MSGCVKKISELSDKVLLNLADVEGQALDVNLLRQKVARLAVIITYIIQSKKVVHYDETDYKI